MDKTGLLQKMIEVADQLDVIGLPDEANVVEDMLSKVATQDNAGIIQVPENPERLAETIEEGINAVDGDDNGGKKRKKKKYKKLMKQLKKMNKRVKQLVQDRVKATEKEDPNLMADASSINTTMNGIAPTTVTTT